MYPKIVQVQGRNNAMSISTPSNGKNAPPCDNDAESRRIGAANKTSLAFIGGQQPTWMLSSSASSLPTKSPTGIRKKKHFSKPVPPRLSLDKIINATVSVQQGQTTQDSQPSLEVVETGCTDRYVLSPMSLHFPADPWSLTVLCTYTSYCWT